MRADMGKVLVERPRLGGWRGESRPGKGYRKRLKKCLDAGDSPPAREGMKAQHVHTKHFNENLAPLRRFLNSNVGRPWDKVYAEICQHVDRGNVVQKHILTHLFDYVVVHTVLIDGTPCRGEQHWGYQYGEPLRTSARRDRWYVCPKSGLLRRSKYIPREYGRSPDPPRTVKLNNKQVCVYRDGRWELISVRLVSQPDSHVSPDYDAILRQYVEHHPSEPQVLRYYRGNGYTVGRRVLTRRELLALPIPVEWLS